MGLLVELEAPFHQYSGGSRTYRRRLVLPPRRDRLQALIFLHLSAETTTAARMGRTYRLC